MNTATSPTTYTVSQVAQITGVSVRTLHHYDALGLLSPAGRSDAGYRLYVAGDLTRLWQILLWRRLGFGLAEISALLDADPQATEAALSAQRARLLAERAALGRTLRTLDTFLEHQDRRETMQSEDFREVFGGYDPADHEAEVQTRWGDSDAYRQSAERTRRYTGADWQTIRGEMDAINARYLGAMRAGLSAGSAEAQAIAADHHAHLERWFYDAPPTMLRGLAQLWSSDERFQQNIDQAGAGLAAYQTAAVTAWADAQQA